MHIDGAKIDFGFAWFGDSIQTSLGKLSRREFGFQYYGDAFDYHVSQNPEFVAMTYAWSGLGLMGFPSKSHVNWVGDFKGDWRGINDQLKNIYLSANCGFSGIGCEIGGYWEAPSNKEQFIRYTQLSSLCPIMINGGALGAFGHHLPWKHDEETVDIYRKFVNLHYSLSPYLFSTAVDAHLDNSTIMKNANIENQSHMLGEQLFVRAITDAVPVVSIQFPGHGNWIDFWDNNIVYAGDSALRQEYDIDHYPVFIKKGAILPWQDTRTQTEVAPDKVIFLVYPEGKTSYIFHNPTGEGPEYSDIILTMDEEKGTIVVQSKNSAKIQFRIWQKCKPVGIENADKWNYDPTKKIITIEKGGSNFKLKII
jgi:alpha-glucosidase (family GH31 glycosyl hydrolase)